MLLVGILARKSSETHRRNKSKPRRQDSEIQQIHVRKFPRLQLCFHLSIQDLYNHRYRASQQMLFPSYSYDSRLYLQSLDGLLPRRSIQMNNIVEFQRNHHLSLPIWMI